MMFKWVFLVVVVALAACEASPSVAPTASPVPTVVPEVTEEPLSRWLETEINGITLGMWRPANWETDLSDGVVLAEHTASANNPSVDGILVHCFVPPLDDFPGEGDEPNYAWAVLDWVVKMPVHTGWDVVMSEPVGFDWDEQQAAYYLLTTGDGVRGVVLALAVPQQEKVVVCNVSAPVAQSNRIRGALPQLLDGFTINGTSMAGAALDTLPDPLSFPRYTLTFNSSTQQVSATSSR